MKKLFFDLFSGLFIIFFAGIGFSANVQIFAPLKVINSTGEPITVSVRNMTKGGVGAKDVDQDLEPGAEAAGGQAPIFGLGTTNKWRIDYKPMGWKNWRWGATKNCEVFKQDAVDGVTVHIYANDYAISMPSGRCEGSF